MNRYVYLLLFSAVFVCAGRISAQEHVWLEGKAPRPDVTIQSIDLIYGEHKRGVPVLLAITAAKAELNKGTTKSCEDL